MFALRLLGDDAAPWQLAPLLQIARVVREPVRTRGDKDEVLVRPLEHNLPRIHVAQPLQCWFLVQSPKDSKDFESKGDRIADVVFAISSTRVVRCVTIVVLRFT